MSAKINLKQQYTVHKAKIQNMVISYIQQQFRNISVNESYQIIMKIILNEVYKNKKYY